MWRRWGARVRKKNAPFWDAERLFRLGNCGDGGVAEETSFFTGLTPPTRHTRATVGLKLYPLRVTSPTAYKFSHGKKWPLRNFFAVAYKKNIYNIFLFSIFFSPLRTLDDRLLVCAASETVEYKSRYRYCTSVVAFTFYHYLPTVFIGRVSCSSIISLLFYAHAGLWRDQRKKFSITPRPEEVVNNRSYIILYTRAIRHKDNALSVAKRDVDRRSI